MLNKISCVVMILIGATLIAGEANETKEAPQVIDAHTLLDEVEKMVKEIPDTKEGCQALLEKVRAWQATRSKQLEAQRISPRYGFECGWMPQQGDEKSKACTEVLLSKDKALQGDYSLEMTMDLVGGHKNKGRGEAWVNMLENPPVGEHIPVNLLGRTVTAWIYAPWRARGKADKPNGFQVFVKDKEWKSQYGPWRNVTEAEWFKISLKVSPFAPKSGDMEPGFDPTQIIAVGVKMGTGGNSKERYKGPVYVDGVNWE